MLYELMATLEAGDLLDHYRLDATIARSGMSTLYKATDLKDGKRVAIKVPHAEMEADPVLVARFEREQEIGQELDHPGVVKTYDGEARSRVYMVMEWVDGRLLRAILNRQELNREGKNQAEAKRAGAGPYRQLPIERAVRLTVNICDALDYMHKHGVVHRDLKPENIMVDDQDQIKIIDFGIALKEDARRLTYVTMSPALGTPDYISPEQVKGQHGDQRSDIYALGVMLYEMLTGETPYSGPSPLAVMNERLVHDPTPARDLRPEISAELQEILNRAMERDPRQRYATAAEMCWELEHQEQVDVQGGPRLPALGGLRIPGRKKMLLYALLALVPVVLFVVMLLLARR
jgi:eukaryotic-like serine/threonine-protein kinase